MTPLPFGSLCGMIAIQRDRSIGPVREGREACKGGSMFDVQKHNSLPGFRKLAYIADEIGFGSGEIADIVGGNPAVVAEILSSEDMPDDTRDAGIVSNNLYLLRMLFSSLLRLSGYNAEKASLLLDDTHEFKQCIEEPPWHSTGDSLRDYLAKGRMQAVRGALDWLSLH